MKILVSDFDATLLNSYYEDNIKCVKKFIKDGNKFIIATGRNIGSIKKELEKVNLKCDFYICKDGSAIYDHNFKLIYRKDIDLNTSKMIINDLLKYNCEVYIDDTNNYLKDYEVSANAVICKISDRKKAKYLLNKITKKYPNIFGYLSRSWINITNVCNSKSNGIKFLIENYNLEGKIITVGDAVNDISMIEEFDGYIMKNNTIKIKTDKIVTNFKELIEKIN